MRLAEKLLPAGYRFRELWLPEQMEGDTLVPSAVKGGHILTNTGAKRGTTTDGVHFVAGVATSNMKFADPYDAVNDWWCSLRFKLDQTFSSGDTDQYLVGKYVDATNYLIVWLDGADGKLKIEHREGNGAETIISAETSWTAGTWYHALASCNTTNGQRLRIDGGTAVAEAGNQTAISLIADICIGARDDGTSTEGTAGVIADVVMGNDSLSSAEEVDLSKGIPPSDAVNFWPLDEGRGVTAYDRGSGADNGTIDSSPTWAWGTVKLSALSLDSINDYAASAAAVDVSGDLTLVWVVKMKSTYDALVGEHFFCRIYINSTNHISLRYGSNEILFACVAAGTSVHSAITARPSINDYWIMIGTITGGTVNVFVNGVVRDTQTGLPAITGLLGTMYLGSNQTPGNYEISKPLLIGIIDGALDAKEAKYTSRAINDMLGLGLNI